MDITTVLVSGTNGVYDREEWTQRAHPFRRVISQCGCVMVNEDRPYGWTTTVDGVFGANTVWPVEGANLYNYLVPVRCPDRQVPSRELLVIAFSYGVNVALHAFAAGLKGHLISVNPPIREDMMATAYAARLNIRRWLNLYGNWKDVWAFLGGIRDGHVGLRYQWPDYIGVDRQELVDGPHGDAVRNAVHYRKWPGWITEVMA